MERIKAVQEVGADAPGCHYVDGEENVVTILMQETTSVGFISSVGFMEPGLNVGLREGLDRLGRDLPFKVIVHPRVHTTLLMRNLGLVMQARGRKQMLSLR